MKRKILSTVVAVVLFSTTVFASPLFPNVFLLHVGGAKNCSVASDITATFCAPSGVGSFKVAVESCAPGGMTMKGIYNGMLAFYGSLKNACQKTAQKYGGTVKGCIGQWTCYWNGGQSTDMSGLCNGNGQACANL